MSPQATQGCHLHNVAQGGKQRFTVVLLSPVRDTLIYSQAPRYYPYLFRLTFPAPKLHVTSEVPDLPNRRLAGTSRHISSTTRNNSTTSHHFSTRFRSHTDTLHRNQPILTSLQSNTRNGWRQGYDLCAWCDKRALTARRQDRWQDWRQGRWRQRWEVAEITLGEGGSASTWTPPTSK